MRVGMNSNLVRLLVSSVASSCFKGSRKLYNQSQLFQKAIILPELDLNELAVMKL